MNSIPYPKMYLYRRIVQAKLFIDQHYSERLDLSAIADEAYFSKFHFIRLFKSAYGRTPHHYLVKVRIDHAQRLLSEDVPVAEVSVMVGFESSTSFAALFKKQTGMSPSVYQRRQRVKRMMIHSNPLVAVPNCFAEAGGWKNSNFQ
jgi:AraC-like DNA-binding protein